MISLQVEEKTGEGIFRQIIFLRKNRKIICRFLSGRSSRTAFAATPGLTGSCRFSFFGSVGGAGVSVGIPAAAL